MARLGTTKHPAVVRVQTEQRAMEILSLCEENGVKALIGLEPDQPEDITDVQRALSPPTQAVAAAKVGRNEPCPCGSGKKSKKCCDGRAMP